MNFSLIENRKYVSRNFHHSNIYKGNRICIIFSIKKLKYFQVVHGKKIRKRPKKSRLCHDPGKVRLNIKKRNFVIFSFLIFEFFSVRAYSRIWIEVTSSACGTALD